MSKLTISDISFCETELPNSTQVKGGFVLGRGFGLVVSSINGVVTAKVTNPSIEYETNSFVDSKTGNTVYTLSDKNHQVFTAVVSGQLNGGAYFSSYSRAST